MSLVLLDPELSDEGTQTGGWMVVIFDNDHTGMEEVVEVLMLATECDEEEAVIEMWEAHTFGKARVHFSGREVCSRVAAIISGIGVKTEVVKEWAD